VRDVGVRSLKSASFPHITSSGKTNIITIGFLERKIKKHISEETRQGAAVAQPGLRAPGS